jgi:hypothetical protein
MRRGSLARLDRSGMNVFISLAGCPAATPGQVSGLLAELVARNALVIALRAPGTETDPLGRLLAQLDAAGVAAVPAVADLVRGLRQVRAGFLACEAGAEEDRAELSARMLDIQPVTGQPLVADLRLDGRVELPAEVAREAEDAAWVLARVSGAPFGTVALKEYHQRFYKRYGRWCSMACLAC